MLGLKIFGHFWRVALTRVVNTRHTAVSRKQTIFFSKQVGGGIAQIIIVLVVELIIGLIVKTSHVSRFTVFDLR